MSYDLKITVYNNRDYEQIFTLNDDEGQPLNLTSLKLIFSVDNGGKLVSYTSGTSSNKCIFIESALEGQIKLELPYSVLKTFEAGTYRHECLIVDGENKRVGLWSGSMIVKDGVSG